MVKNHRVAVKKANRHHHLKIKHNRTIDPTQITNSASDSVKAVEAAAVLAKGSYNIIFPLGVYISKLHTFFVVVKTKF